VDLDESEAASKYYESKAFYSGAKAMALVSLVA
jgi:hypothetical protein